MPSNFCEFSNREQTVYAVTRAPRGPRGRGRDSAQRKPETPNAQTAIPGLLRLARLGSNGRDPARTAHDKLSGPTSPVRHRSSTATTPPRRGPGVRDRPRGYVGWHYRTRWLPARPDGRAHSGQRSFHATPSRCASIMSPAPNRRGVRPPTSCAHATMMRRSCSVFAPTPARPLITSALESRHVPHMPN